VTQTRILLSIGRIPISSTIVTTWGVMAVLTLLALVLCRRIEEPQGVYLLPEVFVEYITALTEGMIGETAKGYVPFIATIALFVGAANLSGVLPGVTPPTQDLATPAALGTCAFAVAHFTSVRTKGFSRFAREFFEPYWWLLPLNLISILSRPLSHIFRLYGNMVGGAILTSVAIMLAPWLVPVPVMAWFSVFIGLIQAFVFTILSVAYIAESQDDRRNTQVAN